MRKTKVEETEFSGGYNLLMLKVEEGNYDEVHRILTEIRNIDINSSNKKGYTALALGVKAGHLEIVKLLISAGAEVNTKNNSGQNPLFLACWYNYESIIQLLLENGAEINSVDHRGWTPLMISAYHGHKQVVKELLNRNADTSIQDLFGKKAIDRAKDPIIIRMLQGDKTLLSATSPGRQGKKSLPFSPTMNSDQKPQKNNPLSILKKSSSKVSIGPSKNENLQNQSLLSPQSTSMSIQKSPSLNSAQKRLTEPRRNSGQFKNSTIKKEVQSAEKSASLLKATLNEIISPIKANTNSSVKIAQSPSATFERQLFKEDMEKLVVDQMSHTAHKIQQIVERKVALEIPMQMQGYENQFKKQVESLLKFKAMDIFKNLQAIFNLKLKFCLTRLGYDTANMGLAAFFENETDYVPEGLAFTKEPLKIYNEKEFKAIEQDIDRLEKSILNQKAPTTLRGYNHDNASPPGHQCDHTSQVHRTEMKNDLLDQLGMEVRSTTEYLLDYSSTKVSDMTREESGQVYKRIMAEVADNMEILEDELKDKFEEIISFKLNKIAEVLKSATGNEVSFDKVKSPEKQTTTSSFKNYKAGFFNTSENKFRSPKYQTETESVHTRDERSVNDFNQDPLRESIYSETKGSGFGGKSQDLSQAKEKIQRIKNSLNFMDDDDEYEPRNERIQDEFLNRETDERPGYTDEEEEAEAPAPEKEENEPIEELERGYNPTYRSNVTTETHYQISNRDYLSPVTRNAQQNTKSGKLSQPLQSRGTAESKANTKKIPIPAHRIATNDRKVEQEMMKYYNFANE